MKYTQLSVVVKMNGIASLIQYIILSFIFGIICGICLGGRNMCGVLIVWLYLYYWRSSYQEGMGPYLINQFKEPHVCVWKK